MLIKWTETHLHNEQVNFNFFFSSFHIFEWLSHNVSCVTTKTSERRRRNGREEEKKNNERNAVIVQQLMVGIFIVRRFFFYPKLALSFRLRVTHCSFFEFSDDKCFGVSELLFDVSAFSKQKKFDAWFSSAVFLSRSSSSSFIFLFAIFLTFLFFVSWLMLFRCSILLRILFFYVSFSHSHRTQFLVILIFVHTYTSYCSLYLCTWMLCHHTINKPLQKFALLKYLWLISIFVCRLRAVAGAIFDLRL